MKSYNYIKPETVVTSLVEAFTILEASGVMDPDSLDAKKTDIEKEEEEKVETGIPTAFTNIWGEDEED